MIDQIIDFNKSKADGLNKVRITAIRQTVYEDLIAKYENRWNSESFTHSSPRALCFAAHSSGEPCCNDDDQHEA